MTTNTWRNFLRKCHKAMSSGEMVTQLVLDAIQQQKLCVLVSKQLMPSLEEYAKTKKTSLDYAVDSDDWDDDSVAASLTNSTSTTITTSPNSTTTDPQTSSTGLDVFASQLATIKRYKPYRYVQAKPGQPVWQAVFGSITAATAIFSSCPSGADWSGDDQDSDTEYSASITQSAKTITVELVVDCELVCTAVLGRRGKLLMLALCRDDQACKLFD